MNIITKEAITIINQIPEINQLPVWYLNPQWWAIIAALLLGVVGLFQRIIQKVVLNWFYHPKINVILNLAPPDCQKINLSSQDNRFVTPAYYLRFKIENSGRYALEDVEAIVTKIYIKNKDGDYILDKDFLPINLLWSHIHLPTMQKIQPKAFKHLDFGPIANGGGGKIAFRFDLCVQPNNLSGYKDPGNYVVEIMFLANNHKPIIKKYNFVFGTWSDDEQEMFSENVTFKEIK